MPVANPSGFDPTHGPRCVSCSCRIDSDRYALECVAERSTTCDPGGDLVQRLRLKNRQLEKDLASLAALREENYAKKTRKVEERYIRILKEKDEKQSAWYAAQTDELRKLRSGAMLMYNLQKGKRIMLCKEMREQKVSFESQLQELLEQIERGKVDHQTEVAGLLDEHSSACSQYEARITALEEHKNLVEEMCRKLEEQADKQHADLRAMWEEKETMHQDLFCVQKKLVDAEKALEILQADSEINAFKHRIKTIKHRARLDKNRLETEVMDYVKYIISTPECGNSIQDLPGALWLPSDVLRLEQKGLVGSKEFASGHRDSIRHGTVMVNARFSHKHNIEFGVSAPLHTKIGIQSRPLRPVGEQGTRVVPSIGFPQEPAKGCVPARRPGSAKSAR